jgi:hypothetical protein
MKLRETCTHTRAYPGSWCLFVLLVLPKHLFHVLEFKKGDLLGGRVIEPAISSEGRHDISRADALGSARGNSRAMVFAGILVDIGFGTFSRLLVFLHGGIALGQKLEVTEHVVDKSRGTVFVGIRTLGKLLLEALVFLLEVIVFLLEGGNERFLSIGSNCDAPIDSHVLGELLGGCVELVLEVFDVLLLRHVVQMYMCFKDS